MTTNNAQSITVSDKRSLIFSPKAGDKIGILKKSDGTLHFFINEQDQGEAVSNLPANVYGAVDIYGAAVRVSITSGTPIQEQDIGQSYSMYKLFLNLHSHVTNYISPCHLPKSCNMAELVKLILC